MTMHGTYPAGFLALALLAGCAPAHPNPARWTSGNADSSAHVQISRAGGTSIHLDVDVARTARALELGLMHVRTMPDSAGMVFELSSPSRAAFWMKDTLIPLDVAFVDGGGRIVDILQMQPCAADPCPLYQPHADYVSALEVNLGVLERDGVKVGDQVSLSRS